MPSAPKEVQAGGVRVVFPARAASSFAQARKPPARVWLRDDVPADAPADLQVPVLVGRALCAALREGAFVSTIGELEALVARLAPDVARKRAIDLADMREYSRHDLAQRLVRDGFDEDLARATAARMEEVYVINDERYADMFVRSKVSAGWGERRIVSELARHGIDVAQTLKGWPYGYLDSDDETARAQALVARRCIPQKNAYQKLVRFLMGRGFSYGVASEAVSRQLEAAAQREDV